MLRDEGRTFGDASTAAFVGGAALLAGGVVLYLTAPAVSTQVSVRARGTMLEIAGRW